MFRQEIPYRQVICSLRWRKINQTKKLQQPPARQLLQFFTVSECSVGSGENMHMPQTMTLSAA